MNREAFLARVRTRLEGVEGPPLPTSFPRTPASGDVASPERFLEALVAIGGAGASVPRDGLAAAIAGAASSAPPDRRVAVIAPDAEPFAAEVDAGLAAAGVTGVRPGADGAAWRELAERAGIGITSAALGIASTGSVLIASGTDSPRAASILPSVHLVILPVDRLVPGLEEAIEVVGSLSGQHSAPFLVTGPSRTSDIEMQMVLGVHGPGAVHVLLVQDA